MRVLLATALIGRGIENETDLLPHDIIADACGKAIADQSVFFSGPSFAKEIGAMLLRCLAYTEVRRQPTQVSIASYSTEHANRVAEIFHRPWLCVLDQPFTLTGQSMLSVS